MPIIPTGFTTPDGSIQLKDGGVTVGISAGGNAAIYATVSDGNITADYEDADPILSIQAAITALEADTPDGGVIYIHAGTYTFTSNASITITDPNIHLIGAGRETIIKKDAGAGTHNTAMFDINNSGCSIQSMYLDCNGSTRDAGNYMLELDDVNSYKGLLVRDVSFYGMNAAGQVCFYMGAGIEVDNCRFYSESASASIWSSPEDHCSIQNSLVMNATTDMTYLIQSVSTVESFKFKNNHLYGSGLTIDLGAAGGDGVDSEHWEISHNSIHPEAGKAYGIYIEDSATTGAQLLNSIISDNNIDLTTADATDTYGMYLPDTISNCKIINNILKVDVSAGTGQAFGIFAPDCNISSNELNVTGNGTGNAVVGIYSDGDALKSKIDNNIIYVDGGDTTIYGIQNITACGSISGNQITVNSVDGSVTQTGYGISSLAKVVNNNSIIIGTISAGGGGGQIIYGIYHNLQNSVVNSNVIAMTDSPNGTNQTLYGIYNVALQTVVNSNNIVIDVSSINDDATSIVTFIYTGNGNCCFSGNLLDTVSSTDNNSVVTGIDLSASGYTHTIGTVFSGAGWDTHVDNIHATSLETHSIGLT